MSEGAAFRRINAARLVRRFPRLLARIERGEIALCTLVRVRDLLTEETLDEILDEVAGKPQREIEAIVARRAPKPEVPERIRRLPVASSSLSFDDATLPLMSSSAPAIAPLSEDRYKVQLTASAALRDKLERARDLMRHKHPSGELALVIEEAVDALLERLEDDRLPNAKPPRRNRTEAKGGRIPLSTRREVFARDREQCTFVSGTYERCPARAFLEIDHVVPRARGGSNEADNLRLRCRAHNRLAAEEVFGKEEVARAIHFRQRKSAREPSAKETRTKSPDSADIAVRGLAGMGFTKSDAQRAVDAILGQARATNEVLSIERVVRQALRVLT